jgi:ribosomal-protein-alanine N-acetyltransferase
MIATPPQKFAVRRMRLEDIDAVHQIDRRSFSLPWPKSSYRFELLENPAARLWVAEAPAGDGGRRVIGLIAVWVIADECHISNLAVHPSHRRQGVGQRLLTTVLENGRTWGIRKVTLEVRESNQAAQRLYHAFGFKTVGRRVRYYQDNQEDALLMTLDGLDRHAAPEAPPSA